MIVGSVLIVDGAGKPVAGVTVAPVNAEAVTTDVDGFAFVDAGDAPWLALERAGAASRLVGAPVVWPLRVAMSS